ncbi:hypothetical protein [Ideonella sp. YS5]|uniref:hypothetical protein n=1 Tax=Ideonella sp. YS5 TaxID=3453714 RepID=UPI003EEF0822
MKTSRVLTSTSVARAVRPSRHPLVLPFPFATLVGANRPLPGDMCDLHVSGEQLIAALQHLARTDEAGRRAIDLQSRAMADAARVAFGAELGATMQRLQSNSPPRLARSTRHWERWLTHAVAAVAASAVTWWLAAYVCAR